MSRLLASPRSLIHTINLTLILMLRVSESGSITLHQEIEQPQLRLDKLRNYIWNSIYVVGPDYKNVNAKVGTYSVSN